MDEKKWVFLVKVALIIQIISDVATIMIEIINAIFTLTK